MRWSRSFRATTSSVADEVLLFGFARLVYAATVRQPEHPCLDGLGGADR